MMKAVGCPSAGPIDRKNALVDFETEKPAPQGRDLLVQVRAISVNPVDCKLRAFRPVEGDTPAILGWDAVGEVVEVGPEAKNFRVGDSVWYAGAMDRPGANSEFHLVDERIVGRKPTTLSHAEAAALPLTTLTAYEMLFERLRVNDPVAGGPGVALIIGGAGGVGSIAIQLLRAKTDLTIIATASRDVTRSWVSKQGAHHVLDHGRPLAEQIDDLGIGQPEFVFSTTHTEQYLDQIPTFIAPQGRFGLIGDPEGQKLGMYLPKSISIHYELMFTRSLFQTADIARQSEILNEVADLVEAGRITSTATETLSPINAATLKKAHAVIEANQTIGKLTIEGF